MINQVDPLNNQNPLLTSEDIAPSPPPYIPPPQENITIDEKKAFDAKMQALLDLLNQIPPDSVKIDAALAELEGMTKTGSMDDAVKNIRQLLDIAYTFPPLEIALSLESGQIDPVTKKPMTIRDLITSVGNDIIKDPNATKSIGDMAIAMVQDAFKIYTDKLKDLQAQIDISKQIITDLSNIQDVLNSIDITSPANFNWNPKSWSDIPKDLQEILKKDYGITDVTKGGNWDLNKYTDAACKYFEKEIGWTTNTADAASSFNKMIAARDSLTDQLDKLDKAGADKNDPTGAYQTVKKVLDDLNKSFDPKVYPPGTTAKGDGSFLILSGPDGADLPGTTLDNFGDVSKNALNALAKFISAGQDKNDGIAVHVDSALSANQNLSTKMTDDMKALNTWFQQLMDVLTAIADAGSKMILSSARSARA